MVCRRSRSRRLVRLRLIEEHQIFEIGSAFIREVQPLDDFHDCILGNVPFAVHHELQMRMARKPSLCGKETQAENRRCRLFIGIIVVQEYTVIRVLQNVRHGRLLIFFCTWFHAYKIVV